MRADLALVGFGHVGRRFARLIEERRDWLALDYDLECRVVGIATRHHGSVFRESGLDAVAMAVNVENGRPIVESDIEAGDSFDVIRRLASTDAPLKAVVETTTLDIAAGEVGDEGAREQDPAAPSARQSIDDGVGRQVEARQHHFDALFDPPAVPLFEFVLEPAEFVEQRRRPVARQVDVFDFPLADPEIGVAVIDEQAGLAHQPQVQPPLNVHEHQRENHPGQPRQQLAPVTEQCFQREREQGTLAEGRGSWECCSGEATGLATMVKVAASGRFPSGPAGIPGNTSPQPQLCSVT